MPTVTGTAEPDILTGSVLADTLSGLGADDVLYGFDGNDLLNGASGDDILHGGSGDDTLIGGAGEDLFYGQSGTDWVLYTTAPVGLVLSLADPWESTGDAAGDIFVSVERFRLSAQDDVFLGSARADWVDGHGGNDTLWGMGGHDQLFGGAGDDELRGGDGNDTLNGGAGIDIASYADASEGFRLDLLTPEATTGPAVGDVLLAVEGYRLGREADEGVAGTAAAMILGHDGDDTLTGGAGADTLDGEAGQDIIDGGAGNDLLRAGDESDPGAFAANWPAGWGGRIAGGTGHDTLQGGNVADSLSGDAGNDSLTGGGGNDRLDGGSGNDTISGGDGDDLLFGGAGADVLHGGAGRDTVIYVATAHLNLATPLSGSGEAAGDALTGAERVEFHGANSRFTGNGQALEVAFLASGGLARPGTGAETIIGNGADTHVDYSAQTTGLRLAAAGGGEGDALTGILGAAAGDVLTGLSRLTLGRAGDRVTLAGAVAGLDLVATGQGQDVVILQGAGMDVQGGGGNDRITGTVATRPSASGPLTLDGGDGNDTITIDSATTTPAPGGGMQGLHMIGGAGHDLLSAGPAGAGASALTAPVTLTGGAGNDTLSAHGTDVLIDGGTEADEISLLLRGRFGGAHGGAGNDTIDADVEATDGIWLTGGAGDDVLTGRGDGFIEMGSGNDTVSFGSALPGRILSVRLEEGDDTATVTGWELEVDGGAGNDLLQMTVQLGDLTQSAPFLMGGEGNDTLSVGAVVMAGTSPTPGLAAQLLGGSGDDLLIGTAPVTLPGGGSVLMTEHFHFADLWGQDSVTGFSDGHDLLRLTGVAGFGALTIVAAGGDTVISHAGQTITLTGVASSQIGAEDFLFS